LVEELEHVMCMDVAHVSFYGKNKRSNVNEMKKMFCFFIVPFLFVPFVCGFSCMFLWGCSKAL